jgi:hypothetical protein
MTGRQSSAHAAEFSASPPNTSNHINMNRNQFEQAWAAWPAQRAQPKTAVERIDEFLKRDREPYDREAINRARRIVFGDAAKDDQPHQYEP